MECSLLIKAAPSRTGASMLRRRQCRRVFRACRNSPHRYVGLRYLGRFHLSRKTVKPKRTQLRAARHPRRRTSASSDSRCILFTKRKSRNLLRRPLFHRPIFIYSTLTCYHSTTPVLQRRSRTNYSLNNRRQSSRSASRSRARISVSIMRVLVSQSDESGIDTRVSSAPTRRLVA